MKISKKEKRTLWILTLLALWAGVFATYIKDSLAFRETLVEYGMFIVVLFDAAWYFVFLATGYYFADTTLKIGGK